MGNKILVLLNVAISKKQTAQSNNSNLFIPFSTRSANSIGSHPKISCSSDKQIFISSTVNHL